MFPSRFVASFAILFVLLAVPLLAGSAGIRNGAVQGAVYDDSGNPLGGVSVVAVRQIAPPIIRNAVTDERGNFFINDLYLGEYVLGFSKFGFETRDTSGGGAGGGGTVTGPNVRVFIESGMASVVPRVTLRGLPDTTNAIVNITVVDLTTDQPITDANVGVGAAGASPTGTPGVYSVSVTPVFANGAYVPQQVTIRADGFALFNESFTVFPRQTQSVTFRVQPTTSEINGRVVLTPGGTDPSATAIRVINVNPALVAPTINANGNFTLRVPASTQSLTRKFTLEFILPGFTLGRVTDVLAPRSGAAFSLREDVILKAETVKVIGQVTLSDSSKPEGAAEDHVLVVELGRRFPIFDGMFELPVPTRRQFTLNVQARNPNTQRIERATTTFTAQSDGTQDPVFNIPAIQTAAP